MACVLQGMDRQLRVRFPGRADDEDAAGDHQDGGVRVPGAQQRGQDHDA